MSRPSGSPGPNRDRAVRVCVVTMNLFRPTLFAASILLTTAIGVGSSAALELGLTPNHVYSLWTNINASLLVISEQTARNPMLPARVEAMSRKSFSGKTPADVLREIAGFQAKVDGLRRTAKLPGVKPGPGADGAITPSVVFLASGNVLDGVVDWLIRHTGPEQLVSQLYTVHDFTGKKHSDVFAMVDLANRRLDAILSTR